MAGDASIAVKEGFLTQIGRRPETVSGLNAVSDGLNPVWAAS